MHQLILYLCFGLVIAQSYEKNQAQYQNGKEKYTALKRESSMPKYGLCWKNALKELENGCKQLTDDMQHLLALHFTNCFLEKTGRETYPCIDHTDISLCTKLMTSEAFNTYSEFFTHTQNMCHFLQAQVWQEETEQTIECLLHSSDSVVKQLEESNEIQNEVLSKQNLSLQNQELFLEQGSELKEILEASGKMLTEFKVNTAEQKALIFEVFNQVSDLQNLVMGEFAGFYSLIFYAIAVLISYLLTSTQRTSGARFWLFVIMTINIIAERSIVMFGIHKQINSDGMMLDEGTVMYRRLWLCRKCFITLGICTWLWCSYRYRDLNAINNQLLVEIKKQNSELQHLLKDSSAHLPVSYYNDISLSPLQRNRNFPSNNISQHIGQIGGAGDAPVSHHRNASDNHTDYSGSESESDDSELSDRTFLPQEEALHHDNESDTSFWTSPNASGSGRDTSLLEEVRELQQSTPVRELTGIPGVSVPDVTLNNSSAFIEQRESNESATRTVVTPMRRGRSPPRVSLAPVVTTSVAVSHRYNLRSRRGARPVIENPLVETESVDDFTNMVRHMNEVTQRTREQILANVNRRNMLSPDQH